MANNSLGNIFKITTWGESHGKAIGVVIDGCPSNIEISEKEINTELELRRPGSNLTSKRKEKDKAVILSGIFKGKTTGCPISIIIFNEDIKSKDYENIKNILRPSHANYTYTMKYGNFDYRGGGRASARETACRVAAGAIAKKILKKFKIKIVSYVKQVGNIKAKNFCKSIDLLKKKTIESPTFCPDKNISKKIENKIKETIKENDSIGGIVEFIAKGIPVGIGDPIFEKLDANLAKAIISIPGVKGVEFGAGFNSSIMSGSSYNDLFDLDKNGNIITKKNNSGGVLGGISNGSNLILRAAFKPTPSIKKTQKSVTFDKQKTQFKYSNKSRHDPCIAIRGSVVLESTAAIVIVDLLLKELKC